MSTDYDKDLINREVVAVCDHYLTNRRGEGKRQTYLCPVCGDRNFEVDPQLGYAGCFDAACEVPRSTDAVAIIAYFEGKNLSGEGFVMCLKKGYEILGIANPEDEAHSQHSSTNGDRSRAMTARKEKTGQREKAMTPRANRGGGEEKVSENGAASFHSSGPQWGAATSVPSETSNNVLTEQPVQAWQENEDGTRSPVAAVVIREPDPDAETADEEELEEAELAEETQCQDEGTDERQTAHEVFEELLRLCRREERDESFLKGRGLDEATIEEGRFGSISKSRCNAVISRLRKKFSEDELLSVPGFRKAENGQIRFSLYGDYTLMPYYDGEGYIRTVEGRFTGEEMGEYDKKYKALLNSAVHLYVHPRYKPDEVVAICEGAIGAMVAARYSFAVASIKGLRNYRRRVDGDGAVYTVLPELEGVDFAGKVVIYIPDLDVKPQTREEAFSLVPEACEWMIERQGGIPKVAMLPEGAKDLDAWILSLDEEEREQKIGELLEGALPLEQWKQQYLNTDEGKNQAGLASGGGWEPEEHGENGASQQEDKEASERDESPELEEVGAPNKDDNPEPELEEVGGWEDSSGSASGQEDSGPTEEDNAESRDEASGQSTDDTDSSRKASQDYDTGGDTEDGKESSSWEQLQLGVDQAGSADDDDTTELKTTELEVSQPGQSTGEDQTEKLEPEPAPDVDEDHPPPGSAYHVGVKGERYLYVMAYVVVTILLSVAAWSVVGGWLSWAGSVVLAAGLALWITVGFGKLYRWHKRRQLQRHIEGN